MPVPTRACAQVRTHVCELCMRIRRCYNTIAVTSMILHVRVSISETDHVMWCGMYVYMSVCMYERIHAWTHKCMCVHIIRILHTRTHVLNTCNNTVSIASAVWTFRSVSTGVRNARPSKPNHPGGCYLVLPKGLWARLLQDSCTGCTIISTTYVSIIHIHKLMINYM